jgi:hypothetical protein
MSQNRLRAAGVSVGGGLLVAAIVIATWTYFEDRRTPAKPWNHDAIKASFVEITFDVGDKVVSNFQYSVDNSTDQDYQLPTDPKSAFVVLPDGRGLSQDKEIGWMPGTYIPAQHKVVVTFHLTYDYNESFPKSEQDNRDKMAPFFNRRLKELDGFVILDKAMRYQIDFPNGWKDLPKDKAG